MQPSHPFLRAITPITPNPGANPGADGRQRLAFTEDWYQGRGVYGGVVAGALARAMAGAADDAGDQRPLRWLSVHFCAPATGVAELTVEPQRRGHGITHLSAALRREREASGPGETIAFASAVFGSRRLAADTWCRPRPPAVQPLEACSPMTSSLAPVFARHFELYQCAGAALLSGTDTPELALWIRFAEPLTIDPIAAIALLDAAPPAALTSLRTLRPVASVALACQFFAPLPLAGASADDPYLLWIRSNVCGDGYAEEIAELWSSSGVLLAVAWQSIALLGRSV